MQGDDEAGATGGAGGDATRTLELLWGHAPVRARRGLSVEAIVAGAILLADERGIDALSMRSLAGALGVGAMSLYTHVPSRETLVVLMVDAVCAEPYADVDAPAVVGAGDWRRALQHVADRNAALFARHPWLHDASSLRPVLGPHTIAKYEAELRAIDGIGLTDVEMDSVLTLVLSHVGATLRAVHRLERDRAASGQSDHEWWEQHGPVLERLMADVDAPVAGRVGEASAVAYDGLADEHHALQFGLDRIFDGVQALLDERAG